MGNKVFNIAIDGPAGAGKSTIAKRIAKELGFIYVDTGAMYRAMALFLLDNGTDPEDEEAVTADIRDVELSIRHENGEQVVILNGENVNSRIRTEEVSKAASVSSRIPGLRAKLVELQQKLAMDTDVVMDGRDIGTVVLPDAGLKIYLTASVEVRAGRRYRELTAKGEACSLEEIGKEIEERDYRDMHREVSPLKKAEDAVEVDTSDMTIDEVTERIISLYRQTAGR